MQRFKANAALSAVAVLIVLAAGASLNRLRADPPAGATPKAKGFAVIELFTSEGCSSCPSAEAALADLLDKPRGRPVYALAFHVDYFDGLGWADRFAAPAFTDRQVAYAKALNIEDVYTPQAIVNGTREFVGANRVKLDGAVAEAIDAPVAGTITATASRADGRVQVEITSAALPADSIVNVALVEDDVNSVVRRGENGGRTLLHPRVVRSFQSSHIDANGSAKAELEIAADVRLDHASIVLFAQRPADRQVIAAAEVVVPR